MPLPGGPGTPQPYRPATTAKEETVSEQQDEKQSGYSVTDLPEGATPDPLGDASLTPAERAGATPDAAPDETGESGNGI